MKRQQIGTIKLMEEDNKMNKIFKSSKFWAGVASFGLAGLLSLAVSAYGPERQTYTVENPADKVVFNSITNNPAVGDERNFVRVVEVGAADNTYKDSVEVKPGKEYEVYIYYHNNAAINLNASGVGIARGTKVKTNFPTSLEPGKKGTIKATISADNATPREVWDEAYMTATQKVSLRYKQGSAFIRNGTKTNGEMLSTNLFTADGTYIGSNKLDGLLPGCAEFSGHIVYRLIADAAGAQVDKKVSIDGKNFQDEVTVKPGDTVTYQVEFANTGTKNLTNVTFVDVFPAGMTLVAGSTYIYNDSYPNGRNLSEDVIGANGYNTGLYGPGSKARLVYQVRIGQDYCGRALNNKIKVTYDGGGELIDETVVRTTACAKGTTSEGTIPDNLPKTGPAEIILAVVVLLSIGVGVYYWYQSSKTLRDLKKGKTPKTKKFKSFKKEDK